MEDQNVIVLTALTTLKVTTLLVLPLAATSLIWSGLRRLAPDGFFAVPLVYSFAKWVGFAMGLLLIYTHQDGRYHDLHAIFLADSPWNISFWQFLSERVNPASYGPAAVFDQLAANQVNAVLPWTMALIAALFAVMIGASLTKWPWAAAGRAAICTTVIVLWAAYITIYAASLLFWLLFLLNSWTFLLLAAILQYYRRRQ